MPDCRVSHVGEVVESMLKLDTVRRGRMISSSALFIKGLNSGRGQPETAFDAAWEEGLRACGMGSEERAEPISYLALLPSKKC